MRYDTFRLKTWKIILKKCVYKICRWFMIQNPKILTSQKISFWKKHCHLRSNFFEMTLFCDNKSFFNTPIANVLIVINVTRKLLQSHTYNYFITNLTDEMSTTDRYYELRENYRIPLSEFCLSIFNSKCTNLNLTYKPCAEFLIPKWKNFHSSR